MSFGVKAQDDCDCVYPIVFMHGWAGGETSWANFADELESIYSNTIIVPDMSQGRNAEGTVYYANLNYKYGQSNIAGADDDANAQIDNGVYVDDDVVVHEQFFNAPRLIPNQCMYAVSFNTRRDLIFADPSNPILVTATSPNWTASTAETPSTESSSNESAPYKQGYALGKAIEAILTASGKEKVIIVAHSMGGLAAREYLQRVEGGLPIWWVDPFTSDGHKVAKLLTVGSPLLGSNSGNSLADNIATRALFSAFGMNLQSEAVRDLRYFYNENIGDCNMPVNNSAYLYGYGEDLIENDPDFYNNDVNCNGTALEVVEGINENGLSIGLENPWDGSYDNSNMPLPKNMKYTYYVSDKVPLLEQAASFLPDVDDVPFWFCLNDTPKFFPTESDGIVEGNRQWLYDGGTGNSSDFIANMSIARPFRVRPNLLSDRITTPDRVGHVNQLDPISWIGIIDNYETNDFSNVARGIDEGDFPYFAFNIELNKRYAGLAQVRADKVAENSNKRIIALSNEIPSVDSDWYRFRINSSVDNIRVDFTPSEMGFSEVDIFKADQVSDFSNSGSPIVSSGSIGSAIVVNSVTYESGPFELGFYYLRVTHDLSQELNREEAWRFPYKFKVSTENYTNGQVCQIRCDDGYQNGDEGDVDCGGSFCEPCSCMLFTNCIIPTPTCNGDGTYNISTAFMIDGDATGTTFTITASSTDGSFVAQPINNATPNESGGNIIANIPIGTTVNVSVQEDGTASCVDAERSAFSPPFTPTTSRALCASQDRFSVSYTVPTDALLPAYRISDGITAQTVNRGNSFFVTYVSGTSVTLTMSDPSNPGCATVSATVTEDCGNPPVDECSK